MKKIVILSAFLSPFRSGAEACAEEMPQLLTGDFAFTIITARMKKSLPVHDHLGSIDVHRIGFGTSFDKWLYPFIAPFAARQYKPDIIHAVLESFAGLALVFCARTEPKAKRILTCQSTNTSFLLGLMHRTADRVTAISTVLVKRAQTLGRTDVVLIPNGIRLADLRAACKEIKKSAERLLFVGRLEPMKGVAVLLDAFAITVPRHPEMRLHVVGDGSLRSSLEARHPHLVQSGHIVFRGYLPPLSVYREYAEADLFCALSRSEALGNVFLEAQASGCAVVATNVGGIPEIVKEGETGLLVAPNDSESAAAAMDLLMSNPSLKETLQKNGIQHAQAYDWKTIAEQYKSVYQEALR